MTSSASSPHVVAERSCVTHDAQHPRTPLAPCSSSRPHPADDISVLPSEAGTQNPHAAGEARNEGEDASSSDLTDLSELSAEDNDEDSNADTATSPSRPRCSQTKSDAASRPPNFARANRPWSQKDDEVLIASYKKHGNRWAAIQGDLDKAGRPWRSTGTIEGRYSLLLAYATRGQRSNPTATTTSSSTQPHSSINTTAASLASASALLHNRSKDERKKPWTSQEVTKLVEIGQSVPPARMYEEWCRAFPEAMRTEPAVVGKWHRLRRGKEGGGGVRGGGGGVRGGRGRGNGVGDRGDDGDGGKSEEEGEEEEENEVETRSAPVAGALSRTSYAPLVSDQSKRQRAHSNWNFFATPLAAPTAGALVAPQAPQLSAEQTPALHGLTSAGVFPHRTQQRPFATRLTFSPAFTAPTIYPRHSFPATEAALLPHLDLHVSIEVISNGFLISDLSPGYQFRVLSPEQCQVVAPTQNARTSSFGSKALSQRAELMPAASFAFQVEADGAIEAVKLPPGTKTSIGLVGKASFGSERGELRVETTFVSADGFMVIFKSRMRG